MTTPHRPCWDAWEAEDKSSFDSIWRIDFSVHIFTNGSVSCSLLPVCTAGSNEIVEDIIFPRDQGVDSLITVIVTEAHLSRSNPSTFVCCLSA